MLPATTTKNLVDAVVTSLERQGIVREAAHAFVDPGVIQWITPPLSLPGTLGGRAVADIADIAPPCKAELLDEFWRRNLSRLVEGWTAPEHGTYLNVPKVFRNILPGTSRFLFCPPSSSDLAEFTAVQFSIEVAQAASRSLAIVDFADAGRDYWVKTDTGHFFGVRDGLPIAEEGYAGDEHPTEVAMLLHSPRGEYAAGRYPSQLDYIRNYVDDHYADLPEAEGLLTALALLKTSFWEIDPVVLDQRLARKPSAAPIQRGRPSGSLRRRLRAGEQVPVSEQRIFAEAVETVVRLLEVDQGIMLSLYSKLVPNFVSSREFEEWFFNPFMTRRGFVPKPAMQQKWLAGLKRIAEMYDLEMPSADT